MTAAPETRDALLDLLALRVTEGLDPSDEARAATLLRSEPDLTETYFEHAAASIDIACDSEIEPLPAELRMRLVRGAADHYATDAARHEGSRGPESREASAAPSGQVVSFRREAPVAAAPPPTSTGFDWVRWGGWIAAAAVLGFTVGTRLLAPAIPESGPVDPLATPAVVTSAGPPATIAAPEPTLAELRNTLIADARDLRRLGWSGTEHALGNGVSGEVVWSDERQEGYMTFRGLAWNDPTQRQYQLWVFDASRSEAHPVDGGVFDIPASSGDPSRETIVRIDPKIRVHEATLFAITLERPGGVVVSSREDLLLIAPVA